MTTLSKRAALENITTLLRNTYLDEAPASSHSPTHMPKQHVNHSDEKPEHGDGEASFVEKDAKVSASLASRTEIESYGDDETSLLLEIDIEDARDFSYGDNLYDILSTAVHFEKK